MDIRNIETLLPLTPVQEELLGQGEVNTTAACGYVSYVIKDGLDEANVERAWWEAIERHACLRTSFAWKRVAKPVQLIHRQASIPLVRQDWRDLSPAGQRARLEQYVRSEEARSFDPSSLPLARMTLCRVEENKYQLILSYHPLVLDARSARIVIGEVIKSGATSSGNGGAMTRHTFRDYVLWIKEQDLNAAEAFWRKHLSGFTTPAPGGVERAIPSPERAAAPLRQARFESGETASHLTLESALSEDVLGSLKRLEQSCRVNPATVVAGAWALLLSRYSGEDEVTLGQRVNGAPIEFLNGDAPTGRLRHVLPWRVKVTSASRVREWLAQLQSEREEMRAFEYVSLERVREWSEIDVASPFFETVVDCESFDDGTPDTVRLSCGLELSEETPVPLSLEASAGGVLRLTFDRSRFDEATAEGMLEHLARLLEMLVSEPQQRLSALSLLTPAETVRILSEWNATGRDYAQENSLQQLFEAHAESLPEAVAVVFEGEQVTYAELNRRANQLAHHLRLLGVGAEVVVGLCVKRSIEMIVGVLGILKAGGAYLPLDPQYPVERLAWMLEDSAAPVLVTLDELVENLPTSWAQIVCLDTDVEEIAAQSGENPDTASAAGPDNLAYVIYTSGSTGKPKGVMVQRRGLSNLATAQAAAFGVRPGTRVLQFASLSFDASIFEITMALSAGATLYIGHSASLLPGPSFAQLLDDWAINLVTLPPSALAVTPTAALPALQTITVAGEACPAETVARWSGETRRFFNLYGPTEATIWTTAAQLDADGEKPTIGRPIANTEVYLLDRDLQPVPVGVPGELFIGGDGLARGYLNRPDLTAERFVPYPFSRREGARLYRTGDLARYLPDGRIDFLGRVDYQAKVRGFRIELGEVDAALRGHAVVSECVTVAREEESGEKILVAYVVLHQDDGQTAPTAEEWRDFLGKTLPDYMIPSAVVVLDEMPLTPNGKIDRRALPAPGHERPALSQSFAAPTTPAEEILADIWRGVLGIDEVGIDDNFFALRGDSIRSVQVVARAQERGLQFTLPQLFQYQTIRELAAQAGTVETEKAILAANAREPFSMISADDRELILEGVEDAYPLTMLQAGMIFHSEYSPKTSVYHSINTFHLRAPFDADALAQAVGDLAAIHESMRTSVDLTNYSEPLQLVHKNVRVPVGVTDLRELRGAEQEEALAQWMEEEKLRHFSWGEVPMVRFHLHRRAEDTFQFTFTAHHAIFDGWSDAVFLTDLFRQYITLLKLKQAHAPVEGAETSPETGGLAPLASHYRDFVALERAALASPQGRAYWQKLLSGSNLIRVPRWPQDASSGEQSLKLSEVGSGVVETMGMRLDERVSEGLRQLARRASVPLKSVLLAAHLRVLSVLSGEREIVTGLVSNGRPETTDGERIIGLFLNTLPFRLSLEGGSWEELVAETFRAERELLPFRRYPLAQIQRENGGRTLFETCFNYTHFHVFESVAGISDVQVLSGGGVSDTNFTLMVDFNIKTQSPEIDVAIGCDESEISTEQAHLIAGYYRRLLEAMAQASEGESYERFSLLSEAERHKLLVEFNDTALIYPDAGGLHGLFESQVERTPAATALVCGDERLSYGELNERANRLAHHLRGLGVGPEERVGILLERSTVMVAALLAVLKAGGCYVPLDAQYPAERLAFMMEDAGLGVLLTTRGLAQSLNLAGGGVRVVYVEEWEQEAKTQSTDNPGIEVSARHLAYLIYTSGSTGRPKGVAIEHHSATVFAHWAGETFDARALRGVLFSTSICFDLSVFELFVTLGHGGKVILAENALQLPALPAAAEVTLVNTVPSAMAELVRMRAVPESVRVVNLAGEALSGDLVAAIYETTQVEAVYNLYGPSEDTTYSTYTPVGRGARVTIGRPITNTRAYVLDERGRPVPVGVVGELHLGGDGVARGYWQRPELTAEKFIPDSFGGEGGERLYRTGDIARYLPTGELEFLGRADNQVKVRGYRIELGEVEAALRSQDVVREAVVVMREEEGLEKRLVAYVVGETGVGEANASELREGLKERLPEYMVPGVFVMMEELPLTPNGKIDRKALPAPEWLEADSAQFVAARTPLEELIADIWSEVLGVERAGVHDNFFELGGHSLLVMRVMSRVRSLCVVELPLHTLFESPTIAELARSVEEARRSKSGYSLPSAHIKPAAREAEGMPLSFAQQRLWFLEQLEPGNSAYYIPSAFRLRGDLDLSALERTFSEIARRHEVLRTTFRARDDQPVQVISEPEAVDLPLLDLSHLPGEEREAEARQIAAAEARLLFDLERGPLMRARLLRLADREHVLLLTMHHIVSDGWSTGVLLREARALYGAFARGEESPLGKLPVQYADFAVWQREWLGGEALEVQLGYWRRQLAGAPPVLDLPTDYARPAAQSWRGAVRTRELSAGLTRSLRALSREGSATLYMTLLAGFQMLLSRYTGQRDVVVGSPVANRTRMEVEGLIGFFVNTLVLRAEMNDDPTFMELLGRVREACLGAYTHQDVPFEKLVEELEPERSLSHAPLFQVMFVMQEGGGGGEPWAEVSGASGSAAGDGGLEVEMVEVESRTAKFDLTLVMGESGGRLGASLEYNTELFNGETMERMLGHFERLLESAVSRPWVAVSRLAMLSGEEERKVLNQWNETGREYPAGAGGLHGLFESQVERTPAATALVCGDERLSYGELNERANRLAHHLRGLGVGPEERVGILLERSTVMVAALLAVLKAGGCYVPLDAQYPAERLAFMMEDAGLGVLLTTRGLAQSLNLAGDGVRVVYVEEWEQEAKTQSTDNPGIEVSARHLAYLIYTSGSTGRPKGVAIEHRSATVFAHWAGETFDARALRGVLFSTSICFDLSVFELFVTLGHGGKVILAENALQLPALPAAAEVTLVNTVPSAMAELVRMRAVPESVRVVNLAGEALSGDLVAAIYETTQVEAVYNLYGPSEDTTYSTYTPVGRGARVTIGRPITNTRAYVLDERGRPVPVGVVGELHLGGDGVARGYWQRPELTAEKFIPDSFGGEGGERLYRTGDIARYLPTGELEFLGRADNQVKVRGYRIELGEVEAALRSQDVVREAVVVMREEEGLEKRLVAYVVGETGVGEANASELREGLKERLPEYMVPGVFVMMEELPLTPNGKIDRKALPAPDESRPELIESLIVPRDMVELQLVRLWEELLGVHPIGVRDNFFELGGHSLLAVRLVSRVQHELGKRIPLAALFQGATIEHLARLLRQHEGVVRTPRLVQLHGGSKPPFICVHPAGGSIFSYLNMVQYLDPEQPLYALHAAGLDEDEPVQETVGAMAADYISAIREAGLEGPYLLGGWSMGGVVAFEMARQLQTEGEEVALLSLIDSAAPLADAKAEVDDMALLIGFAQDIGLRAEHVDVSMEQLLELSMEDQLAFILSRAKKEYLVPQEAELADIYRFFSVYRTNIRAMSTYVPQSLRVRLTLFKAEEQLANSAPGETMGWGELAGEGVEVRVVPGNHYTVLREPHVKVLVEHLQTCINRPLAKVS